MAEHPTHPGDKAPEPDQPDDVSRASAQEPTQPTGEQSSGDGTAEAADQNVEAVAEQALESAERAAETIRSDTEADHASAANAERLQFEDLAPGARNGEAAGLTLLDDIDLNVRVELGRTLMYVEDVLRLNENSVVELDKAAGDPVDIYVNDRHVARGEVLVLNENFCVRISEIIKHSEGSDNDL